MTQGGRIRREEDRAKADVSKSPYIMTSYIRGHASRMRLEILIRHV
jgi:hypothetical protein